MWQDFRLAARLLVKNRGFTIIATITLALGIGVNTTVFSILEGLLLRPLPIAMPEQVVFIDANTHTTNSFPDYLDLQHKNTTFSGLSAYRMSAMAVEHGTGAQHVWGYLVTGNYFETLGVRPVLGRFFTAQEDVRRDASPYAVLSYESWQRRFGGNAAIAGTTIRINGLPYTILGVAPRNFHGTEVFYRPEMWVPMSMQAQIEGRSWLDIRITFNSLIVGRLRPGVTAEQGEADLNTIASTIAADFPRTHEGLRFVLTTPGLFGRTGRRPVSAFMGGVMALAALVLLAGCANLASLLAARVIDRFREIAIRLSLGATRAQIARQLLIETLVLSILGGGAGLALATAVLRLLSDWRLPLAIPVQFLVSPDPRVFAFAIGTTLLVALLAAIAPARRAWRTDPARLAGSAGGRSVAFGWSTRDVLLGVQVTLCCVLITCSLVSQRSLVGALSMPLGFARSGVSAAGFDLALAGYSRDLGSQFQQRALNAVAALPSITAAASTSALPLTTDQSTFSVFPDDGTQIRASEAIEANSYHVSPGYFKVMGTRLVSGRDFLASDTSDRPRVAIVNQSFVRRVMRTDDPVGRRFRTIGAGARPIEVVGVVEDGKYLALSEAPRPVLFFPVAQFYNSSVVIVARSTLPDTRAAEEIGRVVQELDPRVPILFQDSLSDAITFAFLPAQVASVALGVFGILAVALALVGLYGLAAYSVGARRRELGIRIAVGASAPQLLQSVLGRTLVLLACGSLAGILLAAATQGVLGAVVYHASAGDPIIVVGVVVTMLLVGLAAAWTPARRALAVDPVQALRET